MTEPFNIDQIDPATYKEHLERYRSNLPSLESRAIRQVAVSQHLSLYVRSVSCEYGRVTIETNDTMDMAKILSLVGASFILDGKTLRFDSIEPQANHYDFYGSPTTEAWNEIVYKPV